MGDRPRGRPPRSLQRYGHASDAGGAQHSAHVPGVRTGVSLDRAAIPESVRMIQVARGDDAAGVRSGPMVNSSSEKMSQISGPWFPATYRKRASPCTEARRLGVAPDDGRRTGPLDEALAVLSAAVERRDGSSALLRSTCPARRPRRNSARRRVECGEVMGGEEQRE
eukprot:ctg_1304.g410